MLHQNIEADIDHYIENKLPPLQHYWPLLGKELFALEEVLADTHGSGGPPLTEEEKRRRREHIRDTIIGELYRSDGAYSLDRRYLAFLLLKKGRGGEIVGNPIALEKSGKRQELPYTGLEGYYAGCEQTATRPGMTQEEIVREEANIGAELLKSLKKQYVEHNSWAHFTRIKHVLDGIPPDLEELKTIQILWSMIVRRLHVRIYHNPEFEPTLTEQIEHLEQVLDRSTTRTEEEKRLENNLQELYGRLKKQQASLSEEEKKQEQQTRKSREQIRAERLDEFNSFRDETYSILSATNKGQYAIGVQDATLKEATIVETITLPDIPGRDTFSPVSVYLTPEQLEGYLFLAKLGAIGGDPLARSVLVSQ